MSEYLRSRDTSRRLTSRHSRQSVVSHSRDSGFTLVELLVVMIILPMIIGALSLGIIAVFSQQAKVSGRLAGSVDLQVTNATYIRDVESAGTVTVGSTPVACGGVTAGTQLLGLTWSGGQTAVSYVEVAGASGGSLGFTAQLERLYCTNGDNGVPTSVQVVSSDVSTTQQQPPTVTCIDPNANCPSPYNGTANNVASIDFAVYVPDSVTPFDMVASPRQGAGGNLSGTPNFFSPITLSSPTCGTVLTVNNNGHLYINVNNGQGNGFLTVNSPCANTPVVASGGSNQGYLCVAAILTNALPLGSYTNPTASGCPPNDQQSPPWFYFDNFYDPYTVLQAPTQLDSSSYGTCTLNGKRYECSPGYYDTQLPTGTGTFSPGQIPQFKNNYSILFTGGTYEFHTGYPLTIPNGSTTTFQYGTYQFDSSVGANALNVASNNGITVFGDGALFYAPQGNISFGNNNTVDLVANPYYLGVSIWDGPKVAPACPTNPSPYVSLSLSNNGNDTYGGVYIPCGEVLTNQVGAMTATFIVAGTASFNENTTINVTTP